MFKNLSTDIITSVDDQQLYEYPEGMNKVKSVYIGSRSLSFGTTEEDGIKYIVLLAPIELDGIEMRVLGTYI